MLDVFKAQLKAKTKAAGVNLSQKRIDAYADRLHKKNPDVKEVAEHDTLIDAWTNSYHLLM
jgi:ribosomal protein L12E/L44/L45/RPP1/RPP2